MTLSKESENDNVSSEESRPSFSLAVFVVTLALCLTGGLLLSTGILRRDQCEAQSSLPIWMVISGGLLSSLGILGLIYHCCLVCEGSSINCSPRGCVGTTVCALAAACLLGSLGVLLVMFALCLWVAGTFMVADVLNQMSVPTPTYHLHSDQICSWSVVGVSILVLAVGWVSVGSGVCLLSLSLCRKTGDGGQGVFGRHVDLDNLVIINPSCHVYDPVPKDDVNNRNGSVGRQDNKQA